MFVKHKQIQNLKCLFDFKIEVRNLLVQFSHITQIKSFEILTQTVLEILMVEIQ